MSEAVEIDACASCASYRGRGVQYCGACGRRLEPEVAEVDDDSARGSSPKEGAQLIQLARPSQSDEPTALKASGHDGSIASDDATDELALTETPAGSADQADESETTTSVDGVAATTRRRRTLQIVAAVVALALVGSGVAMYLGTRSRLAHTRSELASTSAQLDQTERQLADTSSELESTTADLESTKTDLTQRTAERDSLQTELQNTQDDLAGTQTELSGVKGSLSNAEQRITLQSGQITNLKACLDGVFNALGYVTDGYYSAAIGALEAVDVSCTAAAEAF